MLLIVAVAAALARLVYALALVRKLRMARQDVDLCPRRSLFVCKSVI